ncbi:hypothetical protein A3J32_01835 [Candidatus Saccharibacteria bacterium RIFCSPLOWO2_02_FULL_46_7]|nr:MAG: hypothetical protein A3J32_01835 [Candidatus Saccharibacteria bacterium RIFCSPLOWO2_02_FULL_46_7]
MINLLAPELIARLRFSHQSAILRRWLGILILATVGLVFILGFGWIYINQQNKNLNRNLEATKSQLQAQDLAGIQKKAKDISGNIKVINQVLSREIRFSDLISQIGSVMPPGAILSSLTLSKVDEGLDLSASAKDHTSATQIAINLSDPKNEIFEKVDIVNISCPADNVNFYPCSASFRALFSKTTQSKFLNVPESQQ